MPAVILIVDDSQDFREMLKSILESEGFGVVLAANGQEGITLAKATKPDLIITDIQMPELDGREMIRRIRKEPSLRELPVLALTAYHRERDILRSGATQVIFKPVRSHQLIEQVRQLLSQSDAVARGGV